MLRHELYWKPFCAALIRPGSRIDEHGRVLLPNGFCIFRSAAGNSGEYAAQPLRAGKETDHSPEKDKAGSKLRNPAKRLLLPLAICASATACFPSSQMP